MTWVATGTATLTAAEIAAATAAAEAAAIAAAQAAAAQAATAAATQAAATTAAEAALAPALTEVAATTLPEVAGAVLPEAGGILQAAPGVVPPPATPLPPAGVEQVGQAAVPPPPAGAAPPPPPAGATPPAGIEQAGQPSIQTASGPATSDVASYQSEKAIVDAIQNFKSGPQTELSAAELQATGNYTAPQNYSDMPGYSEAFSPRDSLGPVDQPELLNRPDLVSQNTNPFLQGAKDTLSWMDANPFKTGAAAYMGLQYSGAFNQKQGAGSAPEPKKFNNPYRISPDFQGGPYSEPNVYKPKYAAQGGIMQAFQAGGPVERMSMMNTAMNPQGGLYPQGMIDKTQYAVPIQRPVSSELMAEAPAYERSNPMLMASGGVARFANEGEVEERPTRRYRGNLMGTLDKYNEMIEGKKMSLPTGRADPYTGVVGTFEDNDPDTRLQNADVAAMTRLKKAGKRANVGIAAIPMGVQAGALNLPTNAAGGGIMQANLGSYAAGGNPRLLRGPGDGMSDNIPATIGGKQPARLADGEFVVPADVVSHLGNGSTDAGAKKLHAMMDKVRMDRTGRKKQAPAVKAKKYIPK